MTTPGTFSAVAGMGDPQDLASVEQLVRSEIANVLAVAIDQVDLTSDVMQERDMDSLGAISLVVSFEKRLGFPITATDIEQWRTPERIASGLWARMQDLGRAVP